MVRFVVAILGLLPIQIIAWNLENYNISAGYYVSSVAVYAHRAFLALPRSSCRNIISNPTLVEASWYNEQQMFPRKLPFFLEWQAWNQCTDLQDAISIDLELARPRLWVLDKGNAVCPPKLVIYSLLQKINYTLDVPEAQPSKLNYLVIDNDVKMTGPRGYVGLDAANYILVFALNQFKWWKVELQASNAPISTKYLDLGRKEPRLFMTGDEERGIFALDLGLIRRELDEDEEVVNVTYLGEKLGTSSGLVADLKDGLSYYMPRDYVVVRWNMRQPSRAEHYNILAQSYSLLPFVSQLYTGPQNGIWAVANPSPPDDCRQPPLSLPRRLVKLLKYNIFL